MITLSPNANPNSDSHPSLLKNAAERVTNIARWFIPVDCFLGVASLFHFSKKVVHKATNSVVNTASNLVSGRMEWEMYASESLGRLEK